MNNTATEQSTQLTATQPEDNGTQTERTFTQEEVNRIISDRLARERAKTEPTAEEQRLSDLNARESKIACNEYLAEKGYSWNVAKGMLNIFDTSDSKRFKENVDKLIETFPAIVEPINNPVGLTTSTNIGVADKIATIFRPKI